jgi:uncharacterized protein
MTPQETQLVNDLFDRLARLESAPRDAAAERLIADGLQRSPHAVYALVQTTLVQDEALKRANARIEELQAQTANAEAEEPRPAPSFLDTMREALTGRPAPHGSVPSVRQPAPGTQGPQARNFQPQDTPLQPGYAPPPPPGYPGGAPVGSGGSFLGSAASTAAGVIGGSLLLNGIRSMFGQQAGASALSGVGGSAGKSSSPWSNNADPSAANSDLGRNLGADRISDQKAEAGNDQTADADPGADTDDTYDTDDGDDPSDDDFDDGDSDDDSYDV